MNKIILAVFAVVLAVSVYAQDASFQSYFMQKSEEMNRAYEARDAAKHEALVTEVVSRVNTLPSAERDAISRTFDNMYYDLACTYALTVNSGKAIAALKKSKFDDYRHLMEDSDLDKLRSNPEFRKIVQAAREKGDFVYILHHGGGYGKAANSDIPEFTYQSPAHEKLKRLRERYNLDSIAGNGHDETAVIDLMRWVHYQVPHDGSKGLPDTRNAQSMLRECKRDGLSINCRGLATILNEVYLAAGYQSRMVTCMPKDTNDNDCHVINVVYMPRMRKWVWMDPTFMAYVMDEKGNLLSIEEVRSRMVHNKPLILNADANRNSGFRQRKGWYLDYYMAKNLYKLECPVSSEYDYETKKEGTKRTYVSLVPANAVNNKITVTDKNGNITLTKYFTSNPAAFWVAPAGQRESDYEQVMEAFVQNYNHRDDAAIRKSFAWGSEREVISFWPDGHAEDMAAKHGNIISAKLIGFEADGGAAIFKVKTDKKTFAFGMSLNEGHFENFRFRTSSPEIQKMLASAK